VLLKLLQHIALAALSGSREDLEVFDLKTSIKGMG
jgi:hypothetical protein